MKKTVYRYDEKGFYKEPVELEEGQAIPPDCTEKPLPQINYRPQLVEGTWIETMPQEEIDELLSAPIPPSRTDQLAKDQADLMFMLVMKGVL